MQAVLEWAFRVEQAQLELPKLKDVTEESFGLEYVLLQRAMLACPVTWRPHPEQIASARRGYEDWWQALDWVRNGLAEGGMLRQMEVTAVMPKVKPWGSG